MEQNLKALNLLSLSKKGGNIQVGEENVGSVCRTGHARLILVGADASENAYARAKNFSTIGKTYFIPVPYTKETLGIALGKGMCSMAAITDVSLAQAFMKALGEPEKYPAILEDLEKRVIRVNKRRKEEKAHKKNLKTGKK